MTFKYPVFLCLLFVIPLIALYYIYTLKKYKSGISFPSISVLKKINKNRFSSIIKHMLLGLRLFAIALLVIASARPQGELIRVEKEVKAVDVMLVLDISRSMDIIDIDGNSRLDAAKEVIKQFIAKTKDNRLGLIAFAGESYTLVPQTFDYDIISTFIDEIETGDLEGGTAIGNALANGAERLKKSKSKNKIIILLTDGENTAGSISPANGLEMIKELGIKVYTIALGTTGEVILREKHKNSFTGMVWHSDMKVTSQFNPELLQKIATETNGKFYRVYSKRELVDVYNEINSIEKTKFMHKIHRGKIEYFKYFVLLGLVFLFLNLFIDNILFRVNP